MSDTRLVIGHGPCALRAAAVLAAGGAKVTLLQRGATPSGLRNPDFPTETGRIHVDSACRSASESVLGSLVEAPDTERAVLARGRIHRLPMSRMEVHQLLDDAARLPAARAWVRARSRNAMADVMGGGQEERSHKDWVVRRMGEPAWAHLYRSYAEKRWGLPSEELSVGLARLYHGVEDDRPAQLVGGGEGQALAQAEKCILDAGGEIRTNVTVKRLEVVDGKVAKVVVNRGKKYATNGQVWIAEAPGVIAGWLEGAISHQTKVAAMRLEVQPAVRVALRGDTKGLPWDLHVLDEWVPFHRVVSRY